MYQIRLHKLIEKIINAINMTHNNWLVENVMCFYPKSLSISVICSNKFIYETQFVLALGSGEHINPKKIKGLTLICLRTEFGFRNKIPSATPGPWQGSKEKPDDTESGCRNIQVCPRSTSTSPFILAESVLKLRQRFEIFKTMITGNQFKFTRKIRKFCFEYTALYIR